MCSVPPRYERTHRHWHVLFGLHLLALNTVHHESMATSRTSSTLLLRLIAFNPDYERQSHRMSSAAWPKYANIGKTALADYRRVETVNVRSTRTESVSIWLCSTDIRTSRVHWPARACSNQFQPKLLVIHAHFVTRSAKASTFHPLMADYIIKSKKGK